MNVLLLLLLLRLSARVALRFRFGRNFNLCVQEGPPLASSSAPPWRAIRSVISAPPPRNGEAETWSRFALPADDRPCEHSCYLCYSQWACPRVSAGNCFVSRWERFTSSPMERIAQHSPLRLRSGDGFEKRSCRVVAVWVIVPLVVWQIGWLFVLLLFGRVSSRLESLATDASNCRGLCFWL
jgi:hypothetical protein